MTQRSASFSFFADGSYNLGMNEQLENLRQALAAEQSRLLGTSHMVESSNDGPVNLPVVEALAATVEALAKEITDIKYYIAMKSMPSGPQGQM